MTQKTHTPTVTQAHLVLVLAQWECVSVFDYQTLNTTTKLEMRNIQW